MTKFPVDRFRQQPTPFYYYDLSLLHRTLDEIDKASSAYYGFKVHYAVKANYNPRILKEISRYGLGADTVSAGEIAAAVEAGFAAGDIVFAGVGKSDEEIAYALKTGIGCFNAESVPELEAIMDIASGMGVVAPVALRVIPILMPTLTIISLPDCRRISSA